MRYPLNVRERIGLAVVAAIVAADLCWVMCTRRSEPVEAEQSVAVKVITEPRDTASVSASASPKRKAKGKGSKPKEKKARKQRGEQTAPQLPPPRKWTEEGVPTSSQ